MLIQIPFAYTEMETDTKERKTQMKNTILVVDDIEMNRDMLRMILESDYSVMEAENGKQALDIIMREKDHLSAILLDLIMPEVDGFGVMQQLKDREIMGKIPVLVISGDTSIEVENRCFDFGVSDFIAKPFNNFIIKQRVKNVVGFFEYKNELEAKVEEQTGVLRKAYRTLRMQTDQLKRRNEEIIDMLGTVVEYRNLESGEHIQRVKGYTRILAERAMKEYPEYGLTQEVIDTIVAASALHDVGKITIPDKILLKPGRLTKDEFEYMKSHTIRGCELLDAIKNNWSGKSMEASYEICRHHHERYDGKGYPDGLAGEDIPLSAQLVSIADVYDALVNERCYKDAYSTQEAFRMIVNGECGVFSPKLMEVFRMVRADFEKLATHQ